MVGLLPLCIFYVLSSAFKNRNTIRALKIIFSPTNLLCIIGVIPVTLYFLINDSTSMNICFRNMSLLGWSFNFIKILVLEILVFGFFIYKQIIRNVDFYILLFTSALCLILCMGNSTDFNSRVELPLNFFMTLQIMIYIGKWNKISFRTRILFLIVSLVACVTPCFEMYRTLYGIVNVPSEQYRAFTHDSIFKFKFMRENFVSDSIYTRQNPPLGFEIFRYPQSNDNKHSE